MAFASPRHYWIYTFGCQMNVHDSRRMEELLHAEGFRPTDEASLADLIIVNTCSIRDKAEHKLMSLLGRLRPLKDLRPSLITAVAGCVAQQEGEALLRKASNVDLVFGPDNIPELPALIHAIDGGSPPLVRTQFDVEAPLFLHTEPQVRRQEVQRFVTIMKGCDERCTYCIVPYTRGPERYRDADTIINEIQSLVAGGVREITLLGQTVNSWFDPRTPPGNISHRHTQFPKLLHRIAEEVPQLLRLRYTSPHPRHITPELIDAHRNLACLPAHVHLPVQSGSNAVLKRMLRRYTREEYIERALALKEARPGFTLSADIIVGFPGESEEDFEQTLSLVREVGFVAAFAFSYSPRPYTPALKLQAQDIPEDIKDQRLQRLLALIEVQQSAHLQSLVGQSLRVLVERPNSRDPHQCSGRSERNEIVHLATPNASASALIGHEVDAVVTSANRHSLRARSEVTSASLPAETASSPTVSSSLRLPIYQQSA